MDQKKGSAETRKVLFRLGVVALVALGVVGAVYLRQGTLSQPGVASEGLADQPTAGVAEPEVSLAQPELPAVRAVAVGPGGDTMAETPGGEEANPAAEPAITASPTVLEEPPATPEPPKPLPKLLDLGADKCIPCKQMAPILEELRVQYAGVFEVVFIDVWKNPAEADKYKIRIIPTQIFYGADGKELFRHTGFYSKEQILAKWRQLGVDVGGR